MVKAGTDRGEGDGGGSAVGSAAGLGSGDALVGSSAGAGTSSLGVGPACGSARVFAASAVAVGSSAGWAAGAGIGSGRLLAGNPAVGREAAGAGCSGSAGGSAGGEQERVAKAATRNRGRKRTGCPWETPCGKDFGTCDGNLNQSQGEIRRGLG